MYSERSLVCPDFVFRADAILNFLYNFNIIFLLFLNFKQQPAPAPKREENLSDMLLQMMESDNNPVRAAPIQVVTLEDEGPNFKDIDEKHNELSKTINDPNFSNASLKREFDSKHFTLCLVAKFAVENTLLRNWNENQRYIFGQYVIKNLAYSGFNHLALKNMFENSDIHTRGKLERGINSDFVSPSYDKKQIVSLVAKYFHSGYYQKNLPKGKFQYNKNAMLSK